MTMGEEGPIIEIRGVYTAYEGADRPTLQDVSLTIRRGEYVVIGGPNGAGKTTLLETINGMLPITHGDAVVCGHHVRGDGIQVRCRVGYLLQNFSFDPLTPFTVGEVVMMGRFGKIGLFRKPGQEDHEAVARALSLLGIGDLADRPIGQLSGGQQQKVLLAQNLARDPDILLLDEPFSNLDMFARESINALLTRLVAQGVTVVIVSHAFDDLPDRTVRVVVMQEGRIVLDRECAPGLVEQVIRGCGGSTANA
ncbi:MAG: putative ABC transporter ATP-binding protein [Methanoregulaceae archaeon PtaB.Bin056]|jgi:zinc/manganese transport system ATP-binding protein|nr:MAG: putative ABC transporter ATP-binding protein [Methanoregulaceae archaeon PtaB.Bin056]